MNESTDAPDHVTSRRILQLLQTEGFTAVRATVTKDNHVLTRSTSVDLWALVEIHYADGRTLTKVEGMAIEPTVHSLETDLEDGSVFLGYDSHKEQVDWDKIARQRLQELGRIP